MAGKKTQARLTPEEKLQQALVPEAEQPYKVPANWCWTRLGNVCRFESGFAFKSEYFNKDNGIPVVRISDIKENEVILDNCIFTTELNIDEKFIIRNGDLLIAMSGATTGKNGIFKSDKIAYLNQRVGNIKVIDNNVIKELYRNYYIMNKSGEILKAAYGGAQPNISSSKISLMVFPLPPHAEQQRIVERIESLFAKLDEAKENLQNVLDGFETRKAAILRKAFTGELTANWRKQHGISMDSWEMCEFNQIGDIKTNLVNPIDFQSYPHIAPDNIEKKTGKLLYYNSVAEDNVKSGKHRFYAGQILYSKIRPYLSKVIIAEFDGLCSADMYPIEAKGNTRFLWYYMLSEHFVYQASTAGSRTVLPKINQKELSKLKINMPTLSEQTEIVRIIDDLLAKEQQAKELAENALAKVDLIKKAILAHAFRGELGTNNPADEPAVELLKRVL
jgi:type I restriction enzyme S subunit